MIGHRGRNQWTGRARCGQIIQSGPRWGETCDRIVTELVGSRMLCTLHAKALKRKTMTGSKRAEPTTVRNDVGGGESGVKMDPGPPVATKDAA